MSPRPIPSDCEVKDNILDCVGNTPIVRLRKVTAGIRATVLTKLEFMNPGGRVKDRIGWMMIEDFEKRGKLRPGGMVVECTSGNTGVGLALACCIKGYRATFTMPDKMSIEKIRLLKAYGARVIVTPTAVPPDSPQSYYSVAAKLVEETEKNRTVYAKVRATLNPQEVISVVEREVGRSSEKELLNLGQNRP